MLSVCDKSGILMTLISKYLMKLYYQRGDCYLLCAQCKHAIFGSEQWSTEIAKNVHFCDSRAFSP